MPFIFIIFQSIFFSSSYNFRILKNGHLGHSHPLLFLRCFVEAKFKASKPAVPDTCIHKHLEIIRGKTTFEMNLLLFSSSFVLNFCHRKLGNEGLKTKQNTKKTRVRKVLQEINYWHCGQYKWKDLNLVVGGGGGLGTACRDQIQGKKK